MKQQNMVKKIVFSILLILIGASSFYFGLRPLGPFISWQDQNSETEKGIQKSLTEKSEQILTVWIALKSVHGAVNVLQSADTGTIFTSVEPLEILAPFDKNFSRISGLLLFALGFITFEKLLLAISVSVIFMIVIPVFIIFSVIKIWKNKDVKGIHRAAIVTVLISLVLPFVLPVSLGLSTIIEERLLANNVNDIISSVEYNEENAETMESELRGLRRVGITIMDYVSTARDICNEIFKDIVNFLILFFMAYIFIPIITIIGIYKIVRHSSKMILGK
jgi:hypothetical protein